jgi:protein TonB
MSVYAPVPAFADHARHPRALVLIIAGHAALLAAVMTAKMEVPFRIFPPTVVKLIPIPKPPPENQQPTKPNPRTSTIDHPTTPIPIPQPREPTVDTSQPTNPTFDPGPIIDPGPRTTTTPPQPVRIGPRFVTPASDVKPPYPPSKLRDGEEAALRLKLTIDERGRVTGVEAVGPAVPVFLAAARRHLLAHWRYRPATEGGRPVATSTFVTLRFELAG